MVYVRTVLGMPCFVLGEAVGMCDATIRSAIPMVDFAQRLLHSAEEMQYLDTFEFVNDLDNVTWAPVGSDHHIFNLLGVEAFGK